MLKKLLFASLLVFACNPVDNDKQDPVSPPITNVKELILTNLYPNSNNLDSIKIIERASGSIRTIANGDTNYDIEKFNNTAVLNYYKVIDDSVIKIDSVEYSNFIFTNHLKSSYIDYSIDSETEDSLFLIVIHGSDLGGQGDFWTVFKDGQNLKLKSKKTFLFLN